MQSWFPRAKPITAIEVEICFLLQNDFYFGPDRLREIGERKFVEPLPSPQIPRHVPSMVRTSEAIGYELELERYNAEVIRLAKKHGLDFNAIRHYFWLRLSIWNTAEGIHIGFPWYDTYSEMERFFDDVSARDSGEVFWDADQCWEMQVHAENGEFFAQARDPDYDETHFIVRFPRELLLAKIPDFRNRATSIIRCLSSVIGDDVWTTHVESPVFMHASRGEGKLRTQWWKLW